LLRKRVQKHEFAIRVLGGSRRRSKARRASG
jgi:hypothetical protein